MPVFVDFSKNFLVVHNIRKERARESVVLSSFRPYDSQLLFGKSSVRKSENDHENDGSMSWLQGN